MTNIQLNQDYMTNKQLNLLIIQVSYRIMPKILVYFLKMLKERV